MIKKKVFVMNDLEESVILVDEHDNEIGIKDKLEAHKDGDLHRCFSIFVFNSKGELILQQRALDKYHCGGIWANTCCSHPRPGENINEAVHRRLVEEMGFDTELKEIFTYTNQDQVQEFINILNPKKEVKMVKKNTIYLFK